VTPAATALAFDVGGTTTRCALVTGPEVRGRIARSSVAGDDLAGVLADMAADVVATAGSSLADGQPIGVSVPGPLSADRRRVAFTGNLSLRDYPLADLLEARTGCPVVMDDDANCAALAESRFGAARGTASSVTIVFGTGVGSGIVVAGGLLRGRHSLAGELGHVRVARGGRRCSCGRAGCLEAMANGSALLEWAGPGFATAADVFAAAAEDSSAALDAVAELADYIAVGIVAAASMLDPECIVLAGGIGRQPAVVAAAVPRARTLCIEPLGDLLDIRVAELADDAGLIGAAALALGTGAA
jgi:glucokinase